MIIAAVSCGKSDEVKVKNPFTISSPSPTEQITKVSLDATQQAYVKSGNHMAFRFLDQIYQGESVVCSPLSLQYALAMTVNGASGETAQQILDFLGYGSEGMETLNNYCKALMEQLPAVDLSVALKVTNALLVNDEFPLQTDFKGIMENYYYAAVDNMDFEDPAQIVARINEWAKRNTNGFIDKVLDKDDISRDAVAFLMNALYFKAKWAGSEYHPMFHTEGTYDEDFTLTGGGKTKVKMMHTSGRYKYGEFDGFEVLALPYSNWNYNMYFLLPSGNDPAAMIGKLGETAWSDILAGLSQDAETIVSVPKFDIENKIYLKEDLETLGVRKAFARGEAEFDSMFVPHDGYYFWIDKVIQKARISVAEWGTEAAAVTVVEMVGDNAEAPEPKIIRFKADRPFVVVIGEETSQTILFEGVFTGKESK